LAAQDRQAGTRADRQPSKASGVDSTHDASAAPTDELVAGRALGSRRAIRPGAMDRRSLAALQRMAGNRATTGHLVQRGVVKRHASSGEGLLNRPAPAGQATLAALETDAGPSGLGEAGRAGAAASPAAPVVAQREVEGSEGLGGDLEEVEELLEESEEGEGGAVPPPRAPRRQRRQRRIPQESIRRYLAGERAEGPARPMALDEKARLLSTVLGGDTASGDAIRERMAQRPRGRPRTPDYVINNRRHARHVRGVERSRGRASRREQLEARTTRRGRHESRLARTQRSPLQRVQGRTQQWMRRPVQRRPTSVALERDRVRGRRPRSTSTSRSRLTA